MELAVEPEVVEVGQVMSRGEMLEKLVARSPTAAIEIGGVLWAVCGTLEPRHIANKATGPVGPSTDDWQLALRWL